MGNRRSVEKALEHVGARPRITGDHDAIRAADGLVLPGVGAMPKAMERVGDLKLDQLLRERVERWTVSFAFEATARKNSSASSESKPAIETTGNSDSKRQYGRPETSIAHSPSASSIGTTAWP